MAETEFPSKAAADRLDYGFDFTAFLATCEEGTVVDSFDITATPSGLTIDGVEDVAFLRLNAADVVRHRLVSDIVEAYGRFDAGRAHEQRPRDRR